MLRAYKYRIYPNNAQKQMLAHHFGCVRWVYNWASQRKNPLREDRKTAFKKRATRFFGCLKAYRRARMAQGSQQSVPSRRTITPA